MSALLSLCCCDETATCCSCSLASSYSVAVSLGWTVDGLDSTGSAVQTTTVGAGFSALTVSEAHVSVTPRLELRGDTIRPTDGRVGVVCDLERWRLHEPIGRKRGGDVG